jgi:hypothetical protein
MATYDLSHLTQPEPQVLIGPIQDDEALFLYALIRIKRSRRILEIGGLGGYSAQNFLKAVGHEGTVFTVDFGPVTKIASNHVPLQKDCKDLTAEDVGNLPLDLIFFDCHAYDPQMAAYDRMREQGVITDTTMLALHDTNLHPEKFLSWAYPLDDGWVHQPVERAMVNAFHEMGYDALALNTEMNQHTPEFPMRHGLTVMQKFATRTSDRLGWERPLGRDLGRT